MQPDIGKAGIAYAKSVKTTHLHSAVMPDPGTVFDGTPIFGLISK
jgi:hypothetical protein